MGSKKTKQKQKKRTAKPRVQAGSSSDPHAVSPSVDSAVATAPLEPIIPEDTVAAGNDVAPSASASDNDDVAEQNLEKPQTEVDDSVPVEAPLGAISADTEEPASSAEPSAAADMLVSAVSAMNLSESSGALRSVSIEASIAQPSVAHANRHTALDEPEAGAPQIPDAVSATVSADPDVAPDPVSDADPVTGANHVPVTSAEAGPDAIAEAGTEDAAGDATEDAIDDTTTAPDAVPASPADANIAPSSEGYISAACFESEATLENTTADRHQADDLEFEISGSVNKDASKEFPEGGSATEDLGHGTSNAAVGYSSADLGSVSAADPADVSSARPAPGTDARHENDPDSFFTKLIDNTTESGFKKSQNLSSPSDALAISDPDRNDLGRDMGCVEVSEEVVDEIIDDVVHDIVDEFVREIAEHDLVRAAQIAHEVHHELESVPEETAESVEEPEGLDFASIIAASRTGDEQEIAESGDMADAESAVLRESPDALNFSFTQGNYGSAPLSEFRNGSVPESVTESDFKTVDEFQSDLYSFPGKSTADLSEPAGVDEDDDFYRALRAGPELPAAPPLPPVPPEASILSQETQVLEYAPGALSLDLDDDFLDDGEADADGELAGVSGSGGARLSFLASDDDMLSGSDSELSIGRQRASLAGFHTETSSFDLPLEILPQPARRPAPQVLNRANTPFGARTPPPHAPRDAPPVPPIPDLPATADQADIQARRVGPSRSSSRVGSASKYTPSQESLSRSRSASRSSWNHSRSSSLAHTDIDHHPQPPSAPELVRPSDPDPFGFPGLDSMPRPALTRAAPSKSKIQVHTRTRSHPGSPFGEATPPPPPPPVPQQRVVSSPVENFFADLPDTDGSQPGSRVPSRAASRALPARTSPVPNAAAKPPPPRPPVPRSASRVSRASSGAAKPVSPNSQYAGVPAASVIAPPPPPQPIYAPGNVPTDSMPKAPPRREVASRPVPPSAQDPARSSAAPPRSRAPVSAPPYHAAPPSGPIPLALQPPLQPSQSEIFAPSANELTEEQQPPMYPPTEPLLHENGDLIDFGQPAESAFEPMFMDEVSPGTRLPLQNLTENQLEPSPVHSSYELDRLVPTPPVVSSQHSVFVDVYPENSEGLPNPEFSAAQLPQPVHTMNSGKQKQQVYGQEGVAPGPGAHQMLPQTASHVSAPMQYVPPEATTVEPQAHGVASLSGSGVVHTDSDRSQETDLLRRQRTLFSFAKNNSFAQVALASSRGGLGNQVSVSTGDARSLHVISPLALNKFPFPVVGPKGLIKGKKEKELDAWLSARIAQLGEATESVPGALLYRILRALLSPAEAQASGVREALEPLCRGAELPLSVEGPPSQPAQLFPYLCSGNMDGAVQNALDARQYAHALLLARFASQELWQTAADEFVAEVVRPHSAPLAFAYRVLSATSTESASNALAELKPRSKTTLVDFEKLDANLSYWADCASAIFRTSPYSNTALAELGKLLVSRDRVEEGHVCLMLSGAPLGSTDFSLPLLPPSPQGQPSFDSYALACAYEYALAAPTPHLVPYKVRFAELLADAGHTQEALKVAENVNAILKATKAAPTQLQEYAQSVLQRCTAADEARAESSGGWLQGRFSRPTLEKKWVSSFNRFVSGEDEVAPPERPSSASAVGGSAVGSHTIDLGRAHHNYTPQPERMGSVPDTPLTGSTPTPYTTPFGYQPSPDMLPRSTSAQGRVSTYPRGSVQSPFGAPAQSPFIPETSQSPYAPHGVQPSYNAQSSYAPSPATGPAAPGSQSPYAPQLAARQAAAQLQSQPQPQMRPSASGSREPELPIPRAPRQRASASKTAYAPSSASLPQAPFAQAAQAAQAAPLEQAQAAYGQPGPQFQSQPAAPYGQPVAPMAPYGQPSGQPQTPLDHSQSVLGQSPARSGANVPQHQPEQHARAAQPVHHAEYAPTAGAVSNSSVHSSALDEKPQQSHEEEPSVESEPPNEGGGTQQKDQKKGWLRGWFKKEDPQHKAYEVKLGSNTEMYYDKELKRWIAKGGPRPEPSRGPPPPPKAKAAPAARSGAQTAPAIDVPRPGSTLEAAATVAAGPGSALGAAAGIPPSGALPPSATVAAHEGAAAAAPIAPSPSPSPAGVPSAPRVQPGAPRVQPGAPAGIDDILAASSATGSTRRRAARSRYVAVTDSGMPQGMN